ncbi:MAG: hypothetical protein LAT55_05390 [Opitutales bacterium]|nr:hypothetical protein [Opitutales bacterium]
MTLGWNEQRTKRRRHVWPKTFPLIA